MDVPVARRVRPWLSLVLLLVTAAVAGLNAFPGEAYSPRGRATTSRVVLYVAQLGPVWTVWFGLAALLLAGALWAGRWRQWGHLACMAPWLAFTTALWFGALATGGPKLSAVLATGVLLLHVVMLVSYVDQDAPRERR